MKPGIACKSHLALIVLLSFLLAPAMVSAESFVRELRLGILDHDVDGLWSGYSREEGTDFNAELVFSPGYDFWGGVIRANAGVSINDSGDTSKIYGGGLWEYSWHNGLFIDIGGGLAVHDGETDDTSKVDKKHLGSTVLFRVTFEAGFTLARRHRISVMFDHISNAYLADPNDGLDTLGLRYGYVF